MVLNSYAPQAGYVIDIIIGLGLIVIIYFVAKFLNSRKEKKNEIIVENETKIEETPESKNI